MPIPLHWCHILGEDPDSQSNYKRRLGMYDWQEHEERMKRKYGDIVTNHIPFFRNRFLCECGFIVEDHIRWTDVMDFVITRYNHLMDIPEEVCRRGSELRRRHDFPGSVQA